MIKSIVVSRRVDVLKAKWIEEAQEYFFKLGVFDRSYEQEVSDCKGVAESVFDNFVCSWADEIPPVESWLTPKDAVDEELTYWG